MAVRPGDAQRRHELRLAQRRPVGAVVVQHRFDRLHGAREILVRRRPSARNGCRARRRAHRPPGRNRRRRRASSDALRRGLRLDAGVVAEARAGFLGLGQAELAGRDGIDAVGREQLAHLAQLAGIVGRDDEPARELAMRRAHITASFCRSTSLPTPFLASASSASNCSSVNGIFSAVPCTSTMRPAPVITKLASVSASESSA